MCAAEYFYTVQGTNLDVVMMNVCSFECWRGQMTEQMHKASGNACIWGC